MKKAVVYPEFTWRGIQPNHRAHPVSDSLRVLGGDTETERGEPLTLQAHDGTEELFSYVRSKTIFPTFRDWIFDRLRTHGVNVLYFHFLRFDLPVLLFEKRLELYEQGNEFEFDLHGCHVKGLFGKVNKFDVEYDGKKLQVLDSWAFTQAGLDASLKMYKIAHRKKAKPRCRYCVEGAPYEFGSRRKPREDAKALGCAKCHNSGSRLGWVRFDELPADDWERIEFEIYAKEDARSLQSLGRSIMGFHARYDVRPSISLPQFASRVFRHHFMKKTETINQPPAQAVIASQLSYHGGLNWAPDDCPKVVEDAAEIDINSAYVHAMAVLPQFVRGEYGMVRDRDKRNCGVYKIRGRHQLKYPIIFTDDFKPIRGDVAEQWVTGHELDRALKHGCDLEILDGWEWDHDRSYRHNPLAEFARHFYKLKEETDRESADYYFYKTCGNGLYGKLCATTEMREIIEYAVSEGTEKKGTDDFTYDPVLKKCVKAKVTHRAGLMTQFFIATQITGLVRGMLHDMLTEYDGFHAATDAVKTTAKVKNVPGLGGWKVETRGTCWLFRNKLYLHFADSTEFCGEKKHGENRVEEGKRVNEWRYKLNDGKKGAHLCKYGLHGFKGNVRDLYEHRHELIRGEEVKYSYGHMVGLREGLRRGEVPCSWVEREEVLQLQRA